MLIRKVKSTAISFAIFLSKLTLTLILVYAIFSLCRWLTPRLGHRDVYFGNFENVLIFDKIAGNQPSMVEEIALNARRLEVAQKWLNRTAKRLQSGVEISHQPDWLSLAILTTPRKNGELTQVIGHLLGFWLNKQKSENSIQIPQIFICNTEREGNHFTELSQILNLIGPFVQIVDLNLNGTQKWRQQMNIDQIFAKESADYWNCLAKLAEMAPKSVKYFVLLEDDAIPFPEFQMALIGLAAELDGETEIDYVKLYHPWRFRGIPWIFQSLSFSIAFAYFGHLFFITSSAHFPAANQSRMANLLFFILVIVGTHFIIRAHFLQLFSDIHFLISGTPQLTFAESCCTQAVLFRASIAPKMAKQLGGIVARNGHAKDHILDESSFVGRQTDLNLAIHIGWFSMLRNKTVPTGEIFI